MHAIAQSLTRSDSGCPPHAVATGSGDGKYSFALGSFLGCAAHELARTIHGLHGSTTRRAVATGRHVRAAFTFCLAPE